MIKNILVQSPIAISILVAIASVPLQAFAQGDCESCDGDVSRFPEAAEFLAARGYPPEAYDILLTWHETARMGDRVLVNGYRLAPRDGGAAFDLYCGPDDNLFDSNGLARLGLRPKNWNIGPIEQEAELPASVTKGAVVRPVPVGVLKRAATGPAVRLAAVDMAKVVAEDSSAGRLTAGKGVKRIGVFQELPEAITIRGEKASMGSWRELDDGSMLWSVTISSPDAKGQRIHFSQMSLPPGGSVVVYNARNTVEAYGPYTGFYPGEDGLWSASCFSEDVTVECHVPSRQSLGAVSLAVDRTVHIYADFASLKWGEAEKSSAGACNLDVACYADWHTASTGVGGIGTIGGTGSLFCTGSLIVDSDPSTSVPYFLTANHCIDGQAEASSIEVYWLWQRDSCGGALPSIFDVPRTTGGADYLAGSPVTTGTDFALLRLRNAPPSGVTYLGWSSLPVSLGTQTVCIHHPRGDYKRISLGNTVDSGSPILDGAHMRPLERFLENLWSQGTTEPGSSGSPLMLQATQQIIGQLYGGYASCSDPDEPDYYGRFDVTFPLVQQYLSAYDGPEDVDGNGTVNAVDIQSVIVAVLGGATPYDSDINGDGSVNSIDIQLVIIAVLAA